MLQWSAHHLAWITAASVICTVVLTGLGVWVVVLLPADYFDHGKRRAVAPAHRSVMQLLLGLLKNIAGLLLIAFGMILALPLVPGPGLLFILLGVSMVDLPGKFALERRLIGNRMVLKSVNLIRARLKRPPLTFSHNASAAAPELPMPGEATP